MLVVGAALSQFTGVCYKRGSWASMPCRTEYNGLKPTRFHFKTIKAKCREEVVILIKRWLHISQMGEFQCEALGL